MSLSRNSTMVTSVPMWPKRRVKICKNIANPFPFWASFLSLLLSHHSAINQCCGRCTHKPTALIIETHNWDNIYLIAASLIPIGNSAGCGGLFCFATVLEGLLRKPLPASIANRKDGGSQQFCGTKIQRLFLLPLCYHFSTAEPCLLRFHPAHSPDWHFHSFRSTPS